MPGVSVRIQDLLLCEGYRLSGVTTSGTTCYVRLGKWFVVPQKVPMLLARRGLHVAQLKGAGLVWLCRRDDACTYQFLLVRDKEFCKISCFDLESRTKTILWGDDASMRREMDAQRYFYERGVSVPPIVGEHYASRRVVQGLVGEFLAPRASFDDIVSLLLKAHLGVHATLLDHGSYIGLNSTVLREVGVDGALLPAVDRQMERLQELLLTQQLTIPEVLAHGDPSFFNVLRDASGTLYLIDYDRAFRASVFYDFVYLAVNNTAFGMRRLDMLLLLIRNACGINPLLKGVRLRTLALLMFIGDVLRYIQYHAARQSGSDSAWCQLSLTILRRAIASLAVGDISGVGAR